MENFPTKISHILSNIYYQNLNYGIQHILSLIRIVENLNCKKSDTCDYNWNLLSCL